MARQKKALDDGEIKPVQQDLQLNDTTEEDENQESKNLKCKAYFGIIYPEEHPDWKERLRDAGIRIVAILHDKDVNPDGEVKKEHVHVIGIYDGPVRYAKGDKFMLELGCVKAPVRVRTVISLATASRYLLHLDNPEKFQYERSEILEFGGADFDEYASRSCDREKTIIEMEQYVDENGIMSFRELCAYARENEPTWHRSLTSNSGWFMKEYIKSAYWTQQQGIEFEEQQGGKQDESSNT